MANVTDKSILTAAGKALLAQLNAEEKALVIDKMIFANVPNRPEYPQPDDVVPSNDVVHEAAVEQRGRLSVDSVIYSTTLTSQEGPFEFNWTGAYCSEYGVLVTIDHHALTPKTADEPGVSGNTLVRSVVLEYKDIAEITNITVDASTWQYNATPRMKKMDDDVAQSIIDQNGKDWFIEDGFLVTPQGSAFNIKAGAGYVSGNRVSLEFDRNVQVPNKPSFIYVDAHREGTPTGEQITLFDFVVTAEEKDDYIDANGVKHFVCKIAQVLADGSVSDLRPEGESANREYVNNKDVEYLEISRDIKKACVLKEGINVTDCDGFIYKKQLFYPNTNIVSGLIETINFPEVVIDGVSVFLIPESSFKSVNVNSPSDIKNLHFSVSKISCEYSTWVRDEAEDTDQSSLPEAINSKIIVRNAYGHAYKLQWRQGISLREVGYKEGTDVKPYIEMIIKVSKKVFCDVNPSFANPVNLGHGVNNIKIIAVNRAPAKGLAPAITGRYFFEVTGDFSAQSYCNFLEGFDVELNGAKGLIDFNCGSHTSGIKDVYMKSAVGSVDPVLVRWKNSFNMTAENYRTNGGIAGTHLLMEGDKNSPGFYQLTNNKLKDSILQTKQPNATLVKVKCDVAADTIVLENTALKPSHTSAVAFWGDGYINALKLSSLHIESDGTAFKTSPGVQIYGTLKDITITDVRCVFDWAAGGELTTESVRIVGGPNNVPDKKVFGLMNANINVQGRWTANSSEYDMTYRGSGQFRREREGVVEVKTSQRKVTLTDDNFGFINTAGNCEYTIPSAENFGEGAQLIFMGRAGEAKVTPENAGDRILGIPGTTNGSSIKIPSGGAVRLISQGISGQPYWQAISVVGSVSSV